jgi:amino acid permease
VIIGVGISVDNIEAVFNVVGAICSNSIGILLPCFFYFMLVSKKGKPKTWKYYLTWFIFIIIAPYAIFSIVANYLPEKGVAE